MLWFYKLLLYLKKGQRWTDEFNYLLFITTVFNAIYLPQSGKACVFIKFKVLYITNIWYIALLSKSSQWRQCVLA